jgi:ribosomal protein L11 methyltransferase
MSRTWPALRLRFPPDDAGEPGALQERVAAVLHDLHAVAWQEHEDFWLVFFGTAGQRDRAAARLPAVEPALDGVALEVEDDDWARRSQEGLRPVKVGRVVVAPPWAAAAAAGEGQVVVTILPSMGFGTGHHASTRLCLAMLQALDVTGRSVLDVGTGSGVLALAAWRLGAAPVTGLDEDADALAAARDNLALNGAEGEVGLWQADLRQLENVNADLVLANLTGALLCREASRLARMVAPGGHLIVSGVTAEEEGAVVSALALLGSPAARLSEDGWVGLRFGRTGL